MCKQPLSNSLLGFCPGTHLQVTPVSNTSSPRVWRQGEIIGAEEICGILFPGTHCPFISTGCLSGAGGGPPSPSRPLRPTTTTSTVSWTPASNDRPTRPDPTHRPHPSNRIPRPGICAPVIALPSVFPVRYNADESVVLLRYQGTVMLSRAVPVRWRMKPGGGLNFCLSLKKKKTGEIF